MAEGRKLGDLPITDLLRVERDLARVCERDPTEENLTDLLAIRELIQRLARN